MGEVILSADGLVEHSGHRVWWGAVGATEQPGRAPLLTIHGGPGMSHDCLEPLAALAQGRRVIFYDQFGCGRSDRAADPSLYDIALFVEEVQVVRDALGLDDVHLFAHSYGGPLALEYLLREPRTGVRSLILSNTFASIPALDAGWSRRRGELSPEAERALNPGAEVGTERYGAALGEFINRFVLSGNPPEPLIRSQMGFGAEVYAQMHGASWFEPNGQWADWDVTERLAEIEVPTLVIGGERDQCVPELAQTMHTKLPHSELVVMDTAHLPFYEDSETYLDLLENFLSRAEDT